MGRFTEHARRLDPRRRARSVELTPDEELALIAERLDRLDVLDPANDPEIQELDNRVNALKRLRPKERPTIPMPPPPPPSPLETAREAHQALLEGAKAVDRDNHRAYEATQASLSEVERITNEIIALSASLAQSVVRAETQVPPRSALRAVQGPAGDVRAQVGAEEAAFDAERVDIQQRVLELKIAEHGDTLAVLKAERELLQILGIHAEWDPDQHPDLFEHPPAIGDAGIQPALVGHNEAVLRRGIHPVNQEEEPCPSPQP